MLHFNFEIEKGWNFTPAGLIHMYCYMTGLQEIMTKYGDKLVNYAGKYWHYDHLNLTAGTDTDTIDLYLSEFTLPVVEF